MVVDLPCLSVVKSLTSFLVITISKAYFRFLALTLYQSLLYYLHLSSDFFLSLYSIWLLVFFMSGLWSQISRISGVTRTSAPTLLAKEFSCCVRFCLVEVSEYKVRIRSFIYQRGQKCKSTTYVVAWKVLPHRGIIQLLEVKPASLPIINVL